MSPEERGWPRREDVAPLLGATLSCIEYLRTSSGVTTLILTAMAIWSFIDSTFFAWVGVLLLVLVCVELYFQFVRKQNDHRS